MGAGVRKDIDRPPRSWCGPMDMLIRARRAGNKNLELEVSDGDRGAVTSAASSRHCGSDRCR